MAAPTHAEAGAGPRRRGLTLAAALTAGLVAGGEAAAGRAVSVMAPDGARDATARVVCLEPASEPVVTDGAGRAMLGDGCARAHCTSQRWLTGDVVEGTCKLGSAVVLELELPTSARGEFAIRVEPKGKRGTHTETELRVTEASVRTPLALPPLPPGAYVVSVRRSGAAWSCSSEPYMRQPERLRLSIPWRDALTQRGHVVTAQGSGAPKVPIRTDTSWGSPTAAVGAWSCRPDPPGVAESGPDGRFELPVDPLVETLVVAGGWDDPHGLAFRSRQGATAGTLTLVLKTPSRIEGRVLDDKDVPVACRTEVRAEDPLEAWLARAFPGSVRQGACGPDGKLRLGPLLAPSFDLYVYPEEALPAHRRGPIAPRSLTDLGIIRVDRGVTLPVEVRNVSRAPVSGAEVSARNRTGVTVTRSARTNSAGLAVVKGLPRGTPFDVRVQARDYATLEKTQVIGPVKVVLSKGSTLRGRVLTPEGQPAETASVLAKHEGDAPPGLARTESDGTFAVEVLPGPVGVHASAPGFDDSEPIRLEVDSESSPPDVELTLRERGVFRGVVLDPEENPVPGATVHLLLWTTISDPPELGAQASTVSGADGGFTLPKPQFGQGVVALVRGYAAGFVKYAVDMEGKPVELRLGRAAALRVKLPDALAESARLYLQDGTGIERGVRAGGRSEFTIEDLPSLPVRVALSNGPTREARLVAGEAALVDFRSVGTVHGRVMRVGTGVPRAAVLCMEKTQRNEHMAAHALTDDDGRFELDSVSAGVQRLLAQAPDGRAEATIQVPEGGDVSIDLEISDATLDVLVTDAEAGTPVGGAQVTANLEGSKCWGYGHIGSNAVDGGFFIAFGEAGCLEGASATDGKASLAAVTPGRYRVSVRAKGYEHWSGDVAFSGVTAEMHVELVRGGPPRVRVVLETDLPGVVGILYCIQGGTHLEEQPSSREVVCENLKAGPALVAFRAPGYGMRRQQVEVQEKGETQVTLQVLRGGDLVVPLTSADQEVAIIDAERQLWNQSVRMGWPECGSAKDAEGKLSYVCRGLPPGTYTIQIDGRNRGTGVVRPGETTVVY